MNLDNYIYFDIAATTPVLPSVAKLMNEINTTYFANPSSIHQMGQKSHNLIEKSRKKISSLLNCLSSEIVFTSGGTESNNFVLLGILKKNDHFITTSYEHPSILNVAKELEKKGVEVTYIKPNCDGTISQKKLENAIKKNTKLVSIMYLNNELGTINPINKLSEICKKHNIMFHTDAVQYIGKGKVDIKNMNIDLLSLGAHKFYGPKGIGALIIKKGITLDPCIFGGGQENGYRPGTESAPLIFGMTKALEISLIDIDKNNKQITTMEKLFFNLLDTKKIKYTLNGFPRMNGFINITFHDIDGQVLLMNLDMKGFAISFGSACSSGSAKASNAVLAIGVNEEDAKKTVRISIGKFIEEQHIIALANTISDIINERKKVKQYV